MSVIKNILIAGGTHGNERTGVYLIKKWMKNPECVQKICPSAHVDFLLSNQGAVQKNRRYIDHDLNRAFALSNLSSKEEPLFYEFRLAKKINEKYGPKGENTKTDLIFDIHNTGANMGNCLILSTRDPFTMRASAILTQEFKNTWIYYQPEERGESPYLGTIAKADICLEIGPQPHGTLDASIFAETEKIMLRYLELAEEWNAGTLQNREKISVDVYTQWKDLGYPKTPGISDLQGMLHPHILGRDYQELKTGMPIFKNFNGEDILYDDETAYPIFINEPAYYEKDIAMSLTKKTTELW